MSERVSALLLNMTKYIFFLSPILIPGFVHALTFSEVRSIGTIALQGAVGFFGGAGILVFVVGFVVYITRLGTEHRAEGVHIMSWGIKILFYVVIGAILLKTVVE